jgi:hypothetical protein
VLSAPAPAETVGPVAPLVRVGDQWTNPSVHAVVGDGIGEPAARKPKEPSVGSNLASAI